MAKAKGRAKAFQDPDEVLAKDYDPESNAPESAHGSGTDVSEDENLGTEHYVTVGKSKLRQKENVSLGPEYRGSRVSRSALDDESDDDEELEESEEDDEEGFDDPDTADLEADTAEASDSEIDSDDALGESDAERFKDYSFRGSSKPAKAKGKAGRAKAADFMSDEEEDAESDEDEDMDDGLDALVDGGDDSEDLDDDDEEDDEEGSEDDDDEDEDEDEEEDESAKTGTARPNMSALSNRADVDKGVAIQKQRKIYDGLLNLRIRLQKAIVAANSFPTIESDVDAESEPYEAAEEAAIKLLNTISSLRESIGAPARTGEKRKRELVASMSNEDIWEQLQCEDNGATSFREERLEKWSKKVQSVNMTRQNGISQRNKTLIDALQEQLTVPDNRLVKRTRVPRSCAPAQLAKKATDDEYIYDDADFYQLLLKELVDQRTVEGTADHAAAVPTVMVTATKEAKLRKQVDRKASKGRKMRFTVHEKLQNFMAPEDRRGWEQGAIDRFFGTLFGRKMELNEDESDDDEMDGVDADEEGLRLFRN
ncbi:apoptosis antagonizing transcription factor domain-containing protein [Pochonia chlamydosporia 170]|uniref:Protein BFR2 n=1 Tax=Pochonia chlamydosporia 170 TaxID=1380566 RepID=A0A179G8E7_METCM|nr:apoptosis antagonizing transcription factor domain-containing protein [Pochonia chlamydosporia 170]OAQ73701.1 apoptosis antagonizing transcription factor domain-containing protein [Pochonia chlamydosporia 170]